MNLEVKNSVGQRGRKSGQVKRAALVTELANSLYLVSLRNVNTRIYKRGRKSRATEGKQVPSIRQFQVSVCVCHVLISYYCQRLHNQVFLHRFLPLLIDR